MLLAAGQQQLASDLIGELPVVSQSLEFAAAVIDEPVGDLRKTQDTCRRLSFVFAESSIFSSMVG